MPQQTHPLPPNVAAALQRGQTIEAIKLLREATGLGLKEAKDLVDQHRRGEPVRIPQRLTPASAPVAVADALRRGNKIEAIRVMREATGLGLKEAKEAVESYEAAHPQVSEEGLSPGEVRRTHGRVWFVLALVAIALFVYGWVRAG